jgi:hypothetical protein
MAATMSTTSALFTHFTALIFALFGMQAGATSDHVTLRVADYAVMPVTGTVDGPGNSGSLARVNVLREDRVGTRPRGYAAGG